MILNKDYSNRGIYYKVFYLGIAAGIAIGFILTTFYYMMVGIV